MLLSAPAIAARIVLVGTPEFLRYLSQWSLAALAAPLLALAMVRLVLPAGGRLRGASTPPGRRWLGMLQRAGILLGVVNANTFVQLMADGRTEHVIDDGMFTFVLSALLAAAVLVG